MAGVDTSMYRMEQRNPLEMVAQVQQIQQRDLEINRQRLTELRNTLGALVQKPDLSQRDFIDAAGKLVAARILPASWMAKQLSDLPANPQMLRQYAQNQLAGIMSTQERMNAAYGTPQIVSDGSQLRPMTINPNPGAPQGGLRPLAPQGATAQIPLQQSPEAMGSPMQTIGPDGAPGTVPRSAVQDTRGNPLPPSRRPNITTPAGAAQAGLLPTGQAPGAAEGQAAERVASGQQLAADQQRAGLYTEQTTGLRRAIGGLERLGPTGTGVTSEGLNTLRQAAITLGIPVPQSTNDNAKDYDTVRKDLTDWARQQGNSAGTTNDQLAASFASNPNTTMNNASALEVAKSALALRRMEASRVAAFRNTGLPAERYAQWSATWSRQQDTRAYGFDLMNREQQQRLIRSLGGPDSDNYKRFRQSLQNADAANILERPGR